ncbi:Cytidine deaminase [Candidatus Protochlamydia naegleriophila]|uniref:Cytidine deaminase n=1 Tax=Candidatus Protochlamydia naegleriophila TaxID=389348 RepID=A0A0U5EPU2_9BACT|nr:cytidine deaminase [Candidatus Protochlamydia naegleriophila]CUI15937.1 Cytidine deaminase [Candidatus Protochlamydia naegleriophila]
MNVSLDAKHRLIRLACEVRKHAYAPYSNYLVGAALLTKEGAIFSGCNVENASYGLTCCAERVAIFKAVSEKALEWLAMAIVTKDGGAPCGACRQVMNEFNSDLLVLLGDEKGNLLREMTLKQLLPDAFGPYNLNLTHGLNATT